MWYIFGVLNHRHFTNFRKDFIHPFRSDSITHVIMVKHNPGAVTETLGESLRGALRLYFECYCHFDSRYLTTNIKLFFKKENPPASDCC